MQAAAMARVLESIDAALIAEWGDVSSGVCILADAPREQAPPFDRAILIE